MICDGSESKRGIFDLVENIVCIGDLHGDIKQLLCILQHAKLIEKINIDMSKCFTEKDYSCKKWNWIGGKSICVQLGDMFDGKSRGSGDSNFEDNEVEIYKFLVQLKAKAKKYGGDVLLLLGNHELMNINHDFRYVSKNSQVKCFSFDNSHDEDNYSFKSSHKICTNDRKKLFDINSILLRSMSKNIYGIIKIGPYLFCHAGLEYNLGKKYNFDISYMNNLLKCFLRNKIQNNKQLMNAFNEIYNDSGGILWFRGLAREESNYCNSNKMTFKKLNIKKMIVGHTPQDEISTKCDYEGIVVIDVGLSDAFGKSIDAQYLKIHNGQLYKQKAPISNMCYTKQ